MLRETGRDETIGGGEVLDVAPVLPASRARPDRDVDRVVAERGWTTTDELELLTGVHRPATVGRWIVAPAALAAAQAALRQRVEQSGANGVELAALDERERAVLDAMDDLVVGGMFVRVAAAGDPLATHPALAVLAAGGLAPPDADEFIRGELRELARRGLLVERDGQWFHIDAVATASGLVAGLLADHPEGFTVSQFRAAAGNTRKHALPMLAELDARGITRRRGDVRVAGPRLAATPSGGASVARPG